MIPVVLVRWVAVTLVALAPGSQAQDPEGIVAAMLARAEAELIEGDTAAALSMLEAALETLPDDVGILAELAWVHSARASDIATDFDERRVAEAFALRALQLDTHNPRALAALAHVRLKQHTSSAAGRLLGRAFDSRGFAGSPPAHKADLYYVEAERWAMHVSNFADLILPPTGLAVSSPSCLAYGLFCRAFARPAQFNEVLERARSLEGVAAHERERMIRNYRLALEANPRHLPARAGLLAALADARDWSEYLEVAEAGVLAYPEAGSMHLWLGLGLHRVGRTAAAAQRMATGLERLEPGEAEMYANPLRLLTERDSAEVASAATESVQYERVYWAREDPLYLTAANERWVEHVARIVFADLVFSSGSGRARGSLTDPGRVFVRYGPPRAVWSVARDRSKETDPLSIAKAYELMECGVSFEKTKETAAAPDMTACRQLETQVSYSLQGGGRWIFWNYFPDRPTLVFSRHLNFAETEYLSGSHTENYVSEVRQRIPSHYEHFDRVLDIGNQLARFKGDRPEVTRVEAYVRFPIEELSHPDSRWTKVGLFFHDDAYREKYAWQRGVPTREGSRRLRLTQQLPSGSYDYSIEAHDTLANSIARARGRLDAPGYPPDTLTLSDLLVADNIVLLAPPGTTGEQLRIVGSTDLEFEADEPVWLYWETYGLHGADGLARYDVSLEVRDETERNVLVTVLRAIVDLVGGRATGTEVSWTREVEWRGRDRAVDWLQLDPLAPGRYVVVVGVRDAVSGFAARTARSIRIREEP